MRSGNQPSGDCRHAGRDLAILYVAQCELVAKINGYFDQTIDRVSARFTLITRQVSLIAAFMVAMVLRLDSVALIERLVTGEATPAPRMHRGPASHSPPYCSAWAHPSGSKP